MNDGLIDAFGHNAWATRELLTVCLRLNDAQLQENAAGTYGSVIGTLRHTLASEAGYYTWLTGETLPWKQCCQESARVDELIEYANDLAGRWEQLLATPFDAERIIVAPWDDGSDYDVPAGVFLAQALHHGNEHRAQVSAALSSIGVAVPALGLWDYAEASGRARPTDAEPG